MEKFKKFKIQKKEIIIGGTVGGGPIATNWYGLDYTSGTDTYNPYNDQVHYN